MTIKITKKGLKKIIQEELQDIMEAHRSRIATWDEDPQDEEDRWGVDRDLWRLVAGDDGGGWGILDDEDEDIVYGDEEWATEWKEFQDAPLTTEPGPSSGCGDDGGEEWMRSERPTPRFPRRTDRPGRSRRMASASTIDDPRGGPITRRHGRSTAPGNRDWKKW
jgi:hypothetical protein